MFIKASYRSVLLALFLLLVPFLFAGCGSEAASSPEEKSKKAPLVKVATASQGPIARQIEITGEISATREITIKATVEGPVGFNPWREGDRVEKGEKLIQIDRPLYSAELKEAKADLEVAKSKLADLQAGTRPGGTVLGLFLLLYDSFRFGVEFFSQPDPQLGFVALDFLTMGSILSLPMVAAGIFLFLYRRSRSLNVQGDHHV